MIRLLALVLLVAFVSCRESKSATACAGGGKDVSTEKHGRKAEKGKKNRREETKTERRFHLFKRHRAAKKDAAEQNKGSFKSNPKKRKKEIRKKSKHPEMDLFPKGKAH